MTIKRLNVFTWNCGMCHYINKTIVTDEKKNVKLDIKDKNKNLISKIQTVIDNNQQNMRDQDYVDICNYLKDLYLLD